MQPGTAHGCKRELMVCGEVSATISLHTSDNPEESYHTGDKPWRASRELHTVYSEEGDRDELDIKASCQQGGMLAKWKLGMCLKPPCGGGDASSTCFPG